MASLEATGSVLHLTAKRRPDSIQYPMGLHLGPARASCQPELLLPACSCRLDTTVIQNTALEALRESGLTKDFQVGMAPEAAEKLQ